MDKHLWNAKWIWKNNKTETNQFAYFRKEIDIIKNIGTAKVFVSAHNHFELYVNGTKVSGYVSPAPTHPKKSKFYLCYDVAEQLVTGANTICAVVHFIGGGGQNYVDGLPGFILECVIEFTDNSSEIIITDEEWKVLENTPYKNGTAFQQNRKISAIQDYDATMEDEWMKCGFDDHHWRNACISGINEENWVLKPQSIPEGKTYEIIVPEIVGIQEKGLQVFDAGKIVTGWPRLEIKGIEGVQIMMRYSENMTEEGRVKHNVCNENSENYYDCYKMKGKSIENWEPSFSYKAFRYVEVTGYPEMLRAENIKIVSAGTELNYKGSFNCSNELLNNIYKACIQTQRNNVVGQMVDCPHREQAQYLADSDLQAETFIYSFSNPEVIKKVLLDFKDGQLEDGRFQFVFPSNINPQFDIKIPEWDLHFCTLLWKVYYYYDDISFLEDCYDAAKKMLNYYIGRINERNGLLPKGKGFPEAWNISDWPYPNIDEKGEALTVQNCLFYYVLILMSKIAELLGFSGDQRSYEDKAECLRLAIVKCLYNPINKRFVDSLASEQCHQGTNVVAYQFGLVPVEDREELLNFIMEGGHNCSTLLSLNLLQVLFENGKGNEAYNILSSRDYPGWGNMIEKGYKTIWEGFQDIESHSHAWNAYPARLFVEYIVGIKASAPGFKKVEIRPFVPKDMSFAEGRVSTMSGDIYMRWERKNGKFIINVVVPNYCEAKIFIPKPKENLRESNNILWNKGSAYSHNNIEFSTETREYVIYKISSGHYNFIAV